MKKKITSKTNKTIL